MALLPATAVAAYERLRGEVLDGRARPAGLGAVMHHGLVHGLVILLANATASVTDDIPPSAATPPGVQDPQFLRLLANMVLHTHAEVAHVY